MREAHKIELKQMAKSIRLNEEILRAIEENRWSYFKIDAYLRSYMVAICEKLSLDKSEVLRRLSFEKNSLSSMVSVPDKPEKGNSSSESSGGGGGPQVKIAVALIIVAALFFVVRVLNSESDSAHSGKNDSENSEELDLFAEDAARGAEQGQPAATDSVVAAKPEEIKIDSSAIDTLRFECTPAETDSTCGIALKGLDIKMRYFKRMERRYIARVDTSQITITVPWRTKLFLNNERLDHSKLNTILFYNGEIIDKYNRELR
jgi:cytoskeletal protein RodZ